MSDHAVIGVDPGLDGAIALVLNDRLIEVLDMPTFERKIGKRTTREINQYILTAEIRDLALAVAHVKPNVVIEKVASRPGQGVASAFAFGRGVGMIEGIVAVLGYSLEYSTPNQWKKRAGLINQPKGASRQVASNLWPDCADMFRLVKHDGRADAALIARYGGS